MQERDYQAALKSDIYGAWNAGHQNVCAVMPCGAGKTYTFSRIIHEHKGWAIVIAHRNELVTQMSIALGREGVVHGIIAPVATIKRICREHVRELGTVMFDPNASVKVAGVNTLVNRPEPWHANVTLWVLDEDHHLLRANVFGRAVAMFPNAKGLGVTATPTRSDGKGLGRKSDGLLDVIVEGPEMRTLIDRGFLSDYKIFGPPSDLDLSNVGVAVNGDYKKLGLKKAVRESHIIGDVVSHYKRIAMGKLGITFVPDVETAGDVAAQFNVSGVPAAVLSAKTPGDVRAAIIGQFRRRELLQLVNCDILGEGFDLGGGVAVEVVSMARPTQSYGLYVQQFGRAIRPKADGSPGIIIDHVGNVIRHGLPDKPREWTLLPRDKRAVGTAGAVTLRYCVECTQPYERVLVECPYCGTRHVPGDRTKPEYVDGDLYELSPEVLAQMRGEVAKVDESPERMRQRMEFAGAPQIAVNSAIKNHKARSEAQVQLRESIALWAGPHHHNHGRSDAEIQRRFYHEFGIDVMSAQSLSKAEAEKLNERIKIV